MLRDEERDGSLITGGSVKICCCSFIVSFTGIGCNLENGGKEDEIWECGEAEKFVFLFGVISKFSLLFSEKGLRLEGCLYTAETSSFLL